MGELWTENGLLGKVEDIIELELANAPELDLTVLEKEFVIPKNQSFDFECNLGQINMELLESLAYPDGTLPTSVTLEAKTPEMVQRRRHKKKRINKKWAKRYGYIQVFKTIKFKEVSIIPNEDRFDMVGGSING